MGDQEVAAHVDEVIVEIEDALDLAPQETNVPDLAPQEIVANEVVAAARAVALMIEKVSPRLEQNLPSIQKHHKYIELRPKRDIIRKYISGDHQIRKALKRAQYFPFIITTTKKSNRADRPVDFIISVILNIYVN